MKRDYDLGSMTFVNVRGHPVEVEGCFMPKSAMEPGLEVADLIVHTAGRSTSSRIRRAARSHEGFQTDLLVQPYPGRVYFDQFHCEKRVTRKKGSRRSP